VENAYKMCQSRLFRDFPVPELGPALSLGKRRRRFRIGYQYATVLLALRHLREENDSALEWMWNQGGTNSGNNAGRPGLACVFPVDRNNGLLLNGANFGSPRVRRRKRRSPGEHYHI